MLLLLLPGPLALAESSLFLTPGGAARGRDFFTYILLDGEESVRIVPTSRRKGYVSLERFYQASPRGGGLATYSELSGLEVWSSTGARVWRKKLMVTAFRFSLDGKSLAMSTERGLEVLDLSSKEPTLLDARLRPTWIGATAHGWVARQGSRLFIQTGDSTFRRVATLRPGAIVLTSDEQVFYLEGRNLHRFSVAGLKAVETSSPTGLGEAIIGAAVSPNGRRFLLGTKTQISLKEDDGPPTRLTETEAVGDLAFSADSRSYLWTGAPGGFVQGNIHWRGKNVSFGSVISARFSEGGAGFPVVVQDEWIERWNFDEGKRERVGGLCQNNGLNIAGDVVGRVRVRVVSEKPYRLKERSMPRRHSHDATLPVVPKLFGDDPGPTGAR